MNWIYVDELASKLWDYLQLHQTMRRSDVIIVLGNQDLRVAEWAAKIFLDGKAPFLVICGGIGRLTPPNWKKGEAYEFAKVARKMGVSEEKMILVTEPTNSNDNVISALHILRGQKKKIEKIICVSLPWVQRRSTGYFIKHSTQSRVIFSSPPIPYEKYANEFVTKENIINLLVGEIDRLQKYPQIGMMPLIENVPKEILKATEELKAMGFTEQVLK